MFILIGNVPCKKVFVKKGYCSTSLTEVICVTILCFCSNYFVLFDVSNEYGVHNASNNAYVHTAECGNTLTFYNVVNNKYTDKSVLLLTTRRSQNQNQS